MLIARPSFVDPSGFPIVSCSANPISHLMIFNAICALSGNYSITLEKLYS